MSSLTRFSFVLLLFCACAFGQASHRFPAKDTFNVFTNVNQFSLGADVGPQPFANLPAEVDGRMIYCTDCQQTSPCISGGLGALAVGVQGILSCTAAVTTGAIFPLFGPNGNSGTPSYSFSGSTNTGMFRSGAGFLDFAVVGQDVFQIGTEGVTIFGNGASPVFNFDDVGSVGTITWDGTQFNFGNPGSVDNGILQASQYVGDSFVGGGAVMNTYSTSPNCVSSVGTCGSAAAGRVSIAAGATTVVVTTSRVGANSEFFVQEDPSLGAALGITCNTTTGRMYTITARVVATSFTITSSAAPATNPACLSYHFMNN